MEEKFVFLLDLQAKTSQFVTDSESFDTIKSDAIFHANSFPASLRCSCNKCLDQCCNLLHQLDNLEKWENLFY